jgi:hypothetical protein
LFPVRLKALFKTLPLDSLRLVIHDDPSVALFEKQINFPLDEFFPIGDGERTTRKKRIAWRIRSSNKNFDGLVKSPSAALRFNPAPLDQGLGLRAEQ